MSKLVGSQEGMDKQFLLDQMGKSTRPPPAVDRRWFKAVETNVLSAYPFIRINSEVSTLFRADVCYIVRTDTDQRPRGLAETLHKRSFVLAVVTFMDGVARSVHNQLWSYSACLNWSALHLGTLKLVVTLVWGCRRRIAGFSDMRKRMSRPAWKIIKLGLRLVLLLPAERSLLSGEHIRLIVRVVLTV